MARTAALVAFAVAVAVAAGPARAASIFVAPVTPGVVDDDAASVLTRAVETAVVKRVVDADVVTPRALDTKIEMDLVKACQGDGDDAACVVDFAQGMGVEYVLRPSVQKLGDLKIVTLALYSGKRAALLGQGQRRAEKTEALIDDIPGLVAEVAQAGGLRVIVEQPKSPPYLAYSEIGGGAVVVLGAAAVHAVSLAMLEPAYEAASFDRDQDRAWEAARPFAYVLPVIGYVAGASLVGLGVFTLAREAP